MALFRGSNRFLHSLSSKQSNHSITTRSIFTLSESEQKKAKSLLSPVLGHLSEIVVDDAKGSFVTGVDGERYLDFSTGIGVTNTGHCHPRVVDNVKAAASEVLHAQQNIVYHKPQLKLLLELADLLPSYEQFFFTNSGAEAIEGAVKLARHATGKGNIIVFQGSFHGRTIGTMSLTTSKTIYRREYGPLMPGVAVASFPYCAHCSCINRTDDTILSASSDHYGFPPNDDQCCGRTVDELELLLKQQTCPEETAAVLIEPVLGEGGYVPCPPSVMKGIRKVCDENNLLLIADEVQSGFGRTGRWFAMDHYPDVHADILVAAKGLASGMPLSMVASSKALMKHWQTATHGGTYGGNAVACAAAVGTIDAIKEDNMLENAQNRSNQLVSRLNTIQASLDQEKSPIQIKDVRGLGLMIGVEFDAPSGFVDALSKQCLANKLLLLTTSIYQTIRFIPPLNISEKEMQQGLDIFEQSLYQTLKSFSK